MADLTSPTTFDLSQSTSEEKEEMAGRLGGDWQIKVAFHFATDAFFSLCWWLDSWRVCVCVWGARSVHVCVREIEREQAAGYGFSPALQWELHLDQSLTEV